jgi:hypothetical protein
VSPVGARYIADQGPHILPPLNGDPFMHILLRLHFLPILALVLAVSTIPADQEKKPAAQSKDKDKIKPDWSAEFPGMLMDLNDNEEKGLTFAVKVNYKYTELNADAQRQILQQQQTLAQQQNQLARAKNAQERQNTLNQMANTQNQLEQSAAQLYRIKDLNIDVKCKAVHNLRVRKYEPIQPLDPDTGEFIKMTKELAAKAKGREGYPGYKADAKILKNGQYVYVYLWKETKTPANFLDANKQATMKPQELQAELRNFRYDVIMVYVVADAPPAKDKN